MIPTASSFLPTAISGSDEAMLVGSRRRVSSSVLLATPVQGVDLRGDAFA